VQLEEKTAERDPPQHVSHTVDAYPSQIKIVLSLIAIRLYATKNSQTVVSHG